MIRTLARLSVIATLPLLAACALLGGGKSGKITVYSPQPHVEARADWPSVSWQLGIAKPSASRMIDSPRIAVRPQPHELQVYRGVVWSMPATDLLETAVLRVLEDSGRMGAVARLTTGLHSDYRLVMDIRRFEADYAGKAVPHATIEVSAKLLHSQSQRVVAAQTFLQRTPADGTAVDRVVPAFEQALGQVSQDIAGWSLARGQADHLSTSAAASSGR